jgi:hypothetical protein
MRFRGQRKRESPLSVASQASDAGVGGASFALVLALAACGYHFAAGKSLPGNAKAVDVPIFKNLTTETDADAQFSAALRDELALHGLLSQGHPDATAVGEIVQIHSGPGTVYTVPDGGGVALGTFRIDAWVRVKLMRGNTLLAQAEVRGSEDYSRGVGFSPSGPPGSVMGGDILESEGGRHAAIHRLAMNMMRDALHKLRTDF